MSISKTFLRAGLCVAAPLVLLTSLSIAQGDRRQQPEIKLKNIKILKGLTPQQVIDRMRGFNSALGVECSFCHVINADHTGWDQDTKKPKQMARKMLLMVNDVNKHQKAVDGKLTCFMCHHGQAEPARMPSGGRGEGRGR